MKVLYIIVTLMFCGCAYGTTDNSKEKIVALRNALNTILEDNEKVNTRSEKACTFHACTAQTLGCAELKQVRGCPVCECAEIDSAFGKTPHKGLEKEPRASSGSIDKGACMLLPEQGRCKAQHIRYYYNRAAAHCEKFLYGGCDGNANNFETMEECSVACGLKSKAAVEEPKPAPCLLHGCTPEILNCAAGTGLKTNYYGCTLCECEEEGNVVEQPLVPCPLHSCTAEMAGCEFGLAKDERGCDTCQCAILEKEPRSSSETVDKGACMLVPEQGPCKGSHVRYYYDRAAAHCKKFFYGGCNGNNNNFETMDECSTVCGLKSKENLVEEPLVACPLHACTAEMLQCERGLAKNANGCDLCECAGEGGNVIEEPLACPLHACTAEMFGCEFGLAKDERGCDTCQCATLAKEPRSSSESVDKGACMLVPEQGPCRGNHVRYYYDRAAAHCKKFFYGGCNGNNNNFETMDECSTVCGFKSKAGALSEGNGVEVGCPLHACTAEMLGCERGLAKNAYGCDLCECAGEGGNVIEEPLACPLHACTAEMFGCEFGLAKDERGCDTCQCAILEKEPRASSESVDKGACMLVPEQGPCKGSHERYYYDRAAAHCKKFFYGGCNGNNNNFETMDECSTVCGFKSKAGALSEGNGVEVGCPLHACTAEMLGCERGLAKNAYGCDLCECAGEGGNVIEEPLACPLHACTAEMFGCEFGLAKDERGCDTCQCAMLEKEPRSSSESVDKGACMLVPEQGPCRGNHLRYYYDRAAAHCKKFIYGGCNGNNNNFETMDECSTVCGFKSKPGALSEGGNVVEEPAIPCQAHACTAEMLGCELGLAKNENGCELCECAVGGNEVLIPCPYHACTAENMGCSNGLAQNENGCDLCECAEGPELIPCPYHSCNAEMMGCTMGLAKDQNGCDMCECAGEALVRREVEKALKRIVEN